MEAACGISGGSDELRRNAEECSHAAASNEFLASSLEEIWLHDQPDASDSIGGKVLDAHQTAKPLSDRADQLRDAARVVDANGFQNIPPYLYLLQERALAEFQQQGGVAELQQQSGVPMQRLTRHGKARAAAAGEQTTLLEGHFIDAKNARGLCLGPEGKAKKRAKKDLLCAICVSQRVGDCVEVLKGLSPGFRWPINALITHEPRAADEEEEEEGEREEADVRHFPDMEQLKKSFHPQGTMGKGGRTCALEAFANAGAHVGVSDFEDCAQLEMPPHLAQPDPGASDDEELGENVGPLSQEEADELEARKLDRKERREAYERMLLDAEAVQQAASQDSTTHGANDVPGWHVMQVMKRKLHLKPYKSTGGFLESEEVNIYQPSFWTGRRFALFHIPASNGHWVSLEKITYSAERRPAFVLWEGRGHYVLDFMHATDGGRQPL